MAANPDVLNYLIEGAKRRGIDPATVVRAFGHEGLNVFDPNKPDMGGDEGSSFGPYQLHYKGISKSMPNAGMGDDFTAKTGLSAKDPSTWRQQTDFVLDHFVNGGTWKPWMGAAAEGITGRMGINGAPTVAQSTMPLNGQAQAPLAAGVQGPTAPQVQGPVQPPGNTEVAAKSPFSDLRKKLAKAATGFKMPAIAKNDTTLSAMAMPGAARIDTPEIANFDQNQVAQQRQNLAMAMQRLNTGRLWG